MPAIHRELKGAALTVLAMALFAAHDTATKYVIAAVPVLMVLWFRYMFQAVLTTVAVLPVRGLAVFRTTYPKLQVMRGVLLYMGSLFAFLSLLHMPVGEFTAIVMITPLLITFFASTSLGEHVSPVRWMLVAGGFAGAVLIVRPGGTDFGLTTVLPLGLVICNSSFQALTSKLARTEDPATMHLYTGWTGTLLASLSLPFAWTYGFHWHFWIWLCVIGALAAVGHYLLILGYSHAPAAVLTPYLYAQIGFAMLGGWVVFSHVPDLLSGLGMFMIAACGIGGVMLAMRESRSKQQ